MAQKRDPAVKLVVEALERKAATIPAVGSPEWAAHPDEWVDMATARLFAWASIDAAKKCRTLADLVACDYPAVRGAALLTVEHAPPTPKREP